MMLWTDVEISHLLAIAESFVLSTYRDRAIQLINRGKRRIHIQHDKL